MAAVEPSDVLTAQDAAAYLRVSVKTVCRVALAGNVRGQKVGRGPSGDIALLWA